jgi:hypothetical protein
MAKRFTNLMAKVRGKPKPVVGAVEVMPVAKMVSKEAAMSVIRQFKFGMRTIRSVGIADDVVDLLAQKGLLVKGGKGMRILNPGIFACSRCVGFVGRKDQHEYDKCGELKIDLPFSSMNGNRARSCPSFFLKVLEAV